jgi:hypothetical protein
MRGNTLLTLLVQVPGIALLFASPQHQDSSHPPLAMLDPATADAAANAEADAKYHMLPAGTLYDGYPQNLPVTWRPGGKTPVPQFAMNVRFYTRPFPSPIKKAALAELMEDHKDKLMPLVAGQWVRKMLDLANGEPVGIDHLKELIPWSKTRHLPTAREAFVSMIARLPDVLILLPEPHLDTTHHRFAVRYSVMVRRCEDWESRCDQSMRLLSTRFSCVPSCIPAGTTWHPGRQCMKTA